MAISLISLRLTVLYSLQKFWFVVNAWYKAMMLYEQIVRISKNIQFLTNAKYKGKPNPKNYNYFVF